jgi:hypothetical protein
MVTYIDIIFFGFILEGVHSAFCTLNNKIYSVAPSEGQM